MVTNGLKPSKIKEWLWSAKILTTIIWILFPIGYISNLYLIPYLTNTTWSDEFFRPIMVVELFFWETQLPVNLIFIPPVPFMIVLFLFSVFPSVFPVEKFFKIRGNANVVIEYQILRKILFAATIVLVFFIVFLLVLSFWIEAYLRQPNFIVNISGIDLLFIYDDIYSIIFILPAVPIFILLKLLLEHARKRFRFYYAKACFEIVNKSGNEADKAEYFLLGLEWYNKLVKRVTKGGIDIETIYSKIISHSPLSNNILLNIIVDLFYNGDELRPMRHMLDLLSCWKEGATLVKESLRTKIRESSDLLIPIGTVVITIISTFFLKPPQ